MSSTYLNLDALSSLSEEELQELAKRSDQSVTLFCSSEEAGTRVNSDEVFSDENFQHCQNPRIYFRHSDYRPRLPRPRCLGEQRRTRRRPFRPTVFRRGTRRMFRTRAICSMCHRFHQDSSFGYLEGASRLPVGT